jgi:adenosylmethionine-8-amino-7-oxononanoate aminotransferase
MTINPASLSELDARHVWHPFTQAALADPPLPVLRGEGPYLYTEDGQRLLDGISSWWVNLHGHAHPALANALYRQAQVLEHVLFAGFTHGPAVELAVRLAAVLPPGLSRIFYSDNGSTAVEVGIKMALQYWHNQGIGRTRILALEGAYHGDTFGAMSASERGSFNAPFAPFLFPVEFIPAPLPGQEAIAMQALERAAPTRPTRPGLIERREFEYPQGCTSKRCSSALLCRAGRAAAGSRLREPRAAGLGVHTLDPVRARSGPR